MIQYTSSTARELVGPSSFHCTGRDLESRPIREIRQCEGDAASIRVGWGAWIGKCTAGVVDLARGDHGVGVGPLVAGAIVALTRARKAAGFEGGIAKGGSVGAWTRCETAIDDG